MNRTLATENLTLMNETGYDDMMGSIGDTVDVGGFIDSLFFGMFGSYLDVGYLLLVGGVFYLMWYDHKSLLLPSIIMLILGQVLFTFVPESIVMYVKLFALLGLSAVLIKLYRDGRQ